MTAWATLTAQFPALAGKARGMVKCPCHKDSTASLSVRAMPNGAVQFHCFAGCLREDLRAALGLSAQPRAPYRDIPRGPPPPTLVAEYAYRDANREVIATKRRYQPKRFEWTSWCDLEQRQRPGLPAGGMALIPLYNLPALISSIANETPIVVVEGEKSAERLITLGYTATCCPEGASGAASAYTLERWSVLAGARVALLPDNDDAGRAHTERLTATLAPLVRALCRVELPKLPQKGDVWDWLEAGNPPDALPYWFTHAVPLDCGLMAPPNLATLDADDVLERAGILLDSGYSRADADYMAARNVAASAVRYTATLSTAERLAQRVDDPELARALRELGR